MSLFDALGEGLQVTVVGLCIVFAVLLILMFVMMLMKVVFYKDSGKKETKAKTSTQTQPALQTSPKAVQAQPTVDDSELVAVITAVIAASLNTSTYNLNVKSFRRIQNTSPSWNRAGRRDVIDSRF